MDVFFQEKIQAHRDILESAGKRCSSLETVKHFASLWDTSQKKKKKSHAHFLTHVSLFFSVFTHLLNFVPAEERRLKNTNT